MSKEGAYSIHAFNCLFFYFCLIVLLSGCSDQSDKEDNKDVSESTLNCLSCHEVVLDESHRFDCLNCHQEVAEATGFPTDHPQIIAHPSHPDSSEHICGSCHSEEVEMVTQNNHYQLSGHIKTIRSAFGAEDGIYSIKDFSNLTINQLPETPLQLADDLLRRRCLRCHVYYQGDTFDSVRRATGCGACHLSYANRQMNSHEFRRNPGDDQCLSCHYGNHVGFDYYGRYEHDLNEEYRTPYKTGSSVQQPYGVEYHQLEPDIHQQAGMLCIDCHGRDNVMGTVDSPECSDCHESTRLSSLTSPLISKKNEQFIFRSSATGKSLTIPVMSHPAHERYKEKVNCQACHAQWTFNDDPTHLLRIDHDDFYDFYKLSLDGSSEVLQVIFSHIDDDGELLEPMMTDKFTSLAEQGIWFRGFGERRWEQVLLSKDKNGIITPVRPILNLRLSWIDVEEDTHFDNVEPVPDFQTTLPYAPHTIGPAGLLFEERLRPYLMKQIDVSD